MATASEQWGTPLYRERPTAPSGDGMRHTRLVKFWNCVSIHEETTISSVIPRRVTRSMGCAAKGGRLGITVRTLPMPWRMVAVIPGRLTTRSQARSQQRTSGGAIQHGSNRRRESSSCHHPLLTGWHPPGKLLMGLFMSCAATYSAEGANPRGSSRKPRTRAVLLEVAIIPLGDSSGDDSGA